MAPLNNTPSAATVIVPTGPGVSAPAVIAGAATDISSTTLTPTTPCTLQCLRIAVGSSALYEQKCSHHCAWPMPSNSGLGCRSDYDCSDAICARPMICVQEVPRAFAPLG